MIRALLPAILLLRVVTAQAAPVELEQLTLRSGRVFNEVTVLSSQPDGLRIQHAHGVAFIRTEDLPDEVQTDFGISAETAAASRLEKKRLQDEEDARTRSEKVVVLRETPKVKQDKIHADFRREIFAQAARPGHNFAATDTLLQEQAALWKDAGREDLAAVLEEDRTTLRDREAAKGSVSGDSELQALRERVQALEKLLARRAATPPPPVVAHVPVPAVPPPAPVIQEPAEWVTSPEPIYISPRPIILPPVYPPVPIVPGPPPVVEPPRLPQPVPPSANGNSNGHMQGSHLWKR